MVTAHKIQVQRTTQYYTVGTPGPHIRNFYIACHGYGQLAKKFIYKFEEVDDGKTLVVAPEGLSRFYFKREPEIIGASWMTREDRLDEIEDYTRHIRSLYDQYRTILPADVNIVLFGFSQGCATQVRWLMKTLPAFHHLVLWAGLLPEDIDYTPHQSYFADKQVHFICGDQDEFIKPKYLEWHRAFAKSQHI
ncbi:MAG: phospholipase, partial [Bacteroidota bacterium]